MWVRRLCVQNIEVYTIIRFRRIVWWRRWGRWINGAWEWDWFTRECQEVREFGVKFHNVMVYRDRPDIFSYIFLILKNSNQGVI